MTVWWSWPPHHHDPAMKRRCKAMWQLREGTKARGDGTAALAILPLWWSCALFPLRCFHCYSASCGCSSFYSPHHPSMVNLHEMILILIIPPFLNVFSLTKYHFAADRQFFCFLHVCLVTWRWAGVRQWLPHIWWEGAPPPQDSVGSTWLCKARPTPYGITRLRIVIVLSTKYNGKI